MKDMYHNSSSNNITNSVEGSIHIAGSHALAVFINVISIVWICCFFQISIVLFRLNCCLSKNKTLAGLLSGVNFMILWMDAVVLIYCYSGFGNCVLFPADGNGMVVLFVATPFSYVVQFVVDCVIPLNRVEDRRNVVTTDFVNELEHLIYKERPVVKWTAEYYNSSDDNEPEYSEEDNFEFDSWETSSIWRASFWGFCQVSTLHAESGIPITGQSARFKITIQVCAGDQAVGLKWMNQRHSFRTKHNRARVPKPTVKEHSHTSSRYFILNNSSYCCSKGTMLFCHLVCGFLGIAAIYRMVVYNLLIPEEHYFIYKRVYCLSNINDLPAAHTNFAVLEIND
ncbi:uncharacterized protein [Montipora capricornis]|uniref:uncharacterized protein isoform X1 n=1 Tax=Montipora capricornis TaxID=246305 RepID=UPI0035F1CEE5